MHTKLGGHEEHTMGDFLHWKRRNASWQTLLPITAPTTHSNGKNEYAGNNISNHSESPKSPRWQSWAHTHTHTYTNTHTYTQTYTHKHTHHAHWQSWPLVTFVMPLCLAQPLVKGISEILPHNRKQSIGCFFSLLNTHRLSGRWGLPFLISLL